MQKRKSLWSGGRAVAIVTAVALAVPVFEPAAAFAATPGKVQSAAPATEAAPLTDVSARKRRHVRRGGNNNAAAAAAFVGIIGTIGAIAAAQARRDAYESRYRYYYGPGPGYYGPGPAYYGGPRYYGVPYGPRPYYYGY
ncbi:hypothetical protein BJ123_103221 [Rhodopseudomonas thermotolerans]|uniref:PXPV repeat-containing protein n=2 Tax=Rhodopseudomonas TaxID=1073 RepID=A0A336JIX4_9BRAD|nr:MULTISPECIES: hypothetical protein [Rhodopseudomonas]RED38858.1 hypothetical protein BJ125_103220 [Rhodopseudomonas pentothenatexigens]REG06930.1 hypothetical protein BJ123_103221 [Rhodopseudomonas thermotolerans]SSW89678.1 hypothetical protein SAMN05892882_103220 [Rhodopseudomonas pentothenatexigens]